MAANASLASASAVTSLRLLAGGHLAVGTDSVQLFASSTGARALLDSRNEVAANASLATGSLVFSLQLLAGGHLAAGTDDNGVQLFANATVARALLDSRKEVAANASLATASLICSLQVLADGHLAAGTRSDGVQLFATARLEEGGGDQRLAGHRLCCVELAAARRWGPTPRWLPSLLPQSSSGSRTCPLPRARTPTAGSSSQRHHRAPGTDSNGGHGLQRRARTPMAGTDSNERYWAC